MIEKYKRFLPIAQAFAQMSKYTTGTKVGAVALGFGFEVRASGWNGAPRGCRADVDSRADDRPTRLAYAAHAEANLIANAARAGTPLFGSTLVVTHMPCMSCAKMIVQAGICQVVCPRPDPAFAERWAEDLRLARDLLHECGVDLIEFDTTEGRE